MSTRAHSGPSKSGKNTIPTKQSTIIRLLLIRAMIDVLRAQIAVILNEGKDADVDDDPEADARIIEACRILGIKVGDLGSLQVGRPGASIEMTTSTTAIHSPDTDLTSQSLDSQGDDKAEGSDTFEDGEEDGGMSEREDYNSVPWRRSPPTNYTEEDFASWSRETQRDILGGITHSDYLSS